ncbi:DUF6048 family protein [Bacteroidota bacterium]
MKRILKYTLSLLLLIQLISSLSAQQQKGTRVRGPRIGYDLASLTLLYFEPERKIHTFSVDYEAWQDIYPVMEFGIQNVEIDRENYHYVSNGIFARGGVDLNLMQYEHHNVYEMFYAGLRYGIAYMTHQAENINIPEEYFGGLYGGGGPEVDNQANAHWISLVGGIRAELFKNVFIGWSVLANIKIAQMEDPNMTPYNIPGFGKGDKRATIIINYTIAYRLPLQWYNPKKIVKKRSIPEEE